MKGTRCKTSLDSVESMDILLHSSEIVPAGLDSLVIYVISSLLIGGNGTRNKFIYEVTIWDELRSSFPDDSRTSRSSPCGTALRDRFLEAGF